MNVSDSEIVQSVLAGEGYTAAASAEEADIMLLNTCAIRERAEQRVWSRLGGLRHGYAQVHLCIASATAAAAAIPQSADGWVTCRPQRSSQSGGRLWGCWAAWLSV